MASFALLEKLVGLETEGDFGVFAVGDLEFVSLDDTSVFPPK